MIKNQLKAVFTPVLCSPNQFSGASAKVSEHGANCQQK